MTRRLLTVSTFLFLCAAGYSKTIHVPARSTIQNYVSSAANGDSVIFEHGDYGDCGATWTQNNLVLLGTGGPVFLNAGETLDRKAIWKVTGSNVTIVNMTFENALPQNPLEWQTDADSASAGIYCTGPGMVVRNCYFTNCSNGLVVRPSQLNTGTVTIENSIFVDNGLSNQISHNVDVGEIQKLIVRGCYIHNSNDGYEVRSGADTTILEYNRIADDSSSTAKSLVDIQCGGTVICVGNLFQKDKMTTADKNFITYGFGPVSHLNPDSSIFLVNNTFVSQLSGSAITVKTSGWAYISEMVVLNNLFVGSFFADYSPHGPVKYDTLTNIRSASFAIAGLVKPFFPDYDYHLKDNSPCINAGTSTGTSAGIAYLPTKEFVAENSTHGAYTSTRRTNGALDVGAYENTTGLAVHENSLATISPALNIYPNPASDNSVITLQTDGTAGRWEIVNQFGSIMQASSTATDHLTVQSGALATGMYFVRMRSGSGIVTKPLVVVH